MADQLRTEDVDDLKVPLVFRLCAKFQLLTLLGACVPCGCVKVVDLRRELSNRRLSSSGRKV